MTTVTLAVAVEAPQHSGLTGPLHYSHVQPLPPGTLLRVPLGKRDLLGTARARALEHHVFEQMRHTHLFRTLMQRCGADPCPESN